MRDRLLIFSGLLVFVILVSYPVWYGLAAKTSTKEPEIKTPTGLTCVAPPEYMRTAHMELLMKWRDGKVREQARRYTAYNGKVYNVSLTSTCLGQCHGSKEQFCDRCHTYAGVSAPNCFECHTSPPNIAVAAAFPVTPASGRAR